MTEAHPNHPASAEPISSAAARGGIPRWEKWVVGLLLAWFAARLVFLALRLHPMVPPDEVTHFGRCLAYSKVLLIPDNSPETLVHGLVNHRPYLYYWLMGKLLNLNVFPESDLGFLRLANAAMGLLTVVYGYRWMCRMTDNPLVRVLFVVLITNTLMFTGVSAAVSYDNLANLLAAMAVYYLFAFFEGRRPESLAVFALVLLAGALTKRTFLPLGFIMLAVLALRERRALPTAHRHLLDFARSLKPPEWRRPALCVLLGLGLALNLGLYGGNWLRYEKLVPGFDQVVGFEGAMKNRIFARDFVTREFRQGRLSYDQALRMTEKIKHRGDRGDAKILLRAAQLPDSALIGPVAYVSAWSQQMLLGIVGYWGHRQALKNHDQMLPYFAILALAGVLFIRKWRQEEARGYTGWAALIGFGYAMVLIWLVNYPSYLETRFVQLAVQGRYVFPVLVPLWGLLAHTLLVYWPRRAQVAITLVVAGVFLYGDSPFFLANTDGRWFS
jgi:hypothetical protein